MAAVVVIEKLFLLWNEINIVTIDVTKLISLPYYIRYIVTIFICQNIFVTDLCWRRADAAS